MRSRTGKQRQDFSVSKQREDEDDNTGARRIRSSNNKRNALFPATWILVVALLCTILMINILSGSKLKHLRPRIGASPQQRNNDDAPRRHHPNLFPDSSPPSSFQQHQPIVLIHYHKTGHDVALNLLDSILKQLKIPQGPNWWAERGHAKARQHDHATGCPSDLDLSKNDSMFVQTAPDFFCNIDTIIPPNARILHLVRDPYNMALSNYLYHAQVPTPEQWVKLHNPCLFDNDSLGRVLPHVGWKFERVEKVAEMCQNYTLHDPTHYYAHLRNLPRFDGLRLATAQLVLNRMDLLRMPNNMKRLANCHASVMTTTMTDWMDEHTRETCKKALDFMFGSRMTSQEKSGIADKMEASFNKSKSGSHYTQNQISEHEREMLIQNLKQDEILGPILNQIKQLMDDSVPPL